MKKRLKKIALGLLAVIAVTAAVGGGWIGCQVNAFDASMAKVYDVAVPAVTASKDPEVIARGKHLSESIAGCTGSDCHGADLGGGKPMDLGPLGTMSGPNITTKLTSYSDAELVRLIRHGVRKDGRSVSMMPSQDFGWMPVSDAVAIASYLRTLPPVSRPDGATRFGTLAKVLDRKDMITIDVARRIDHLERETATAPKPEPTAAYGRFLAKGCEGCHGATLSGGPIPGAPSTLAVPRNLTPHESGLKGWTFAHFEKMCSEGVRPDGKKLDPFMPVEALGKMDETEKTALWAYLQTLPPKPFGDR